MRVVRDLSELPEPFHTSAVTIGNFDGIHLAHCELLRRVVSSAETLGGTSAVVTFDPHPAQILSPNRAPKILTPIDLKTKLIEQAGIELLVILHFDMELAALSPAEFVSRVLVQKLRAGVVHVGANFRFGHRRAGDTAVLAELGKQGGFRVETLPIIELRGHRISSSQVRQMLALGRVEIAGRMLGRPYAVRGAITEGEGVGRKQTVPTLNLSPIEQQLPKNGVYITRTRIGETGTSPPSVIIT
jgi:riboflavin kinase / FMN adenylyltransferase